MTRPLCRRFKTHVGRLSSLAQTWLSIPFLQFLKFTRLPLQVFWIVSSAAGFPLSFKETIYFTFIIHCLGMGRASAPMPLACSWGCNGKLLSGACSPLPQPPPYWLACTLGLMMIKHPNLYSTSRLCSGCTQPAVFPNQMPVPLGTELPERIS